MPNETKKKCFVISPIDDDGSPTRKRADWLLKGIVKPVLENPPYNYHVQRADEFPDPGMITSQVIEAILDWDLVIADLSGKNPNVFYELALRHMANKPIIHMFDKNERLPFDVFEYRSVPYSVDDWQNIEDAKDDLIKQLNAVEHPDYKLSNPVTKARGYQELAKSTDPQEKLIAELIEKFERFENRLNAIDDLVLYRHNNTTTPVPEGLGSLFSSSTPEPKNSLAALAKALAQLSPSVPPPSPAPPPRIPPLPKAPPPPPYPNKKK